MVLALKVREVTKRHNPTGVKSLCEVFCVAFLSWTCPLCGIPSLSYVGVHRPLNGRTRPSSTGLNTLQYSAIR